MVPGTNVFMADPHFTVLGLQTPAYGSPGAFWKVIRETVVLRWFGSRATNQVEKIAFDGAVSYLAESVLDETRTAESDAGILVQLGEQLRNSLPREMDERMSNEEKKTEMNVIFTGQVIEMMANMIGERGVYDAIHSFLVDVRQKGEASLLKSFDRVFLQQEVKDWCGRPLNVTEFLTQWIEKKLPKSGVSFTTFLLHIVLSDRKNVPTVAVNHSEDTEDYPPIPLFMRSLTEHNESIIWQSQECGIFLSVHEAYVMTLINNIDVIFRSGSPVLQRLTYEEEGPLSYSTLLSNIYLNQMKISLKEQLVFVADRLHFLLSNKWSPDYEGITRLMKVFLKENDEVEPLIIFLPMFRRLYRIMAGTYHERIFLEYATKLLQSQHWSLWWRDCRDPRKNLHRRILFPLSVRWNFQMARQTAMVLFNDIISKSDYLNPDNHHLVHLAESVFCAAVLHNVSYFYLFHERLTNVNDDASDKDYLYDEVIRSLGCTDSDAAITRYANVG
ncbi:hypothetical protein AB6A40_008178 [Gnathostoma spinigerum]|uniref:Uncharacterized protein n=1 Tax=Gnathostoma spinigerum TaxID=75299 RepID=A0ABD6EW34_9BILA